MTATKKMWSLATLSLITLLLCASQLWAGAWTQPQGKLYTRLAYSEYEAQRFFNEHGTSHDYSPGDAAKKRDFDYDEQTWSFYAEYGLLDNLTLIGSFDYKELEWTFQSITLQPSGMYISDKNTKSSGLADINFGLRFRLLATESGALSIQALYKSAEAYDEKDLDPLEIQLGDAQDDFELRLQFGQSLYPLFPGYCNIEAGYRWRSEYMADEFVYLLEVGADITKSLYVRTKLDGTANVGNGNDPAVTLVDANPNEIDLGKLELTVGYKIISMLAVEASYFNELYGANTTKGDTWSLALAATF
ncbi:MAG: hypothetical protein JXR59_10160 [Desulfuromonadaceae bacterium]|nr:hypothetical protein [Desulfuromonadaceae bacterium]